MVVKVISIKENDKYLSIKCETKEFGMTYIAEYYQDKEENTWHDAESGAKLNRVISDKLPNMIHLKRYQDNMKDNDN